MLFKVSRVHVIPGQFMPFSCYHGILCHLILVHVCSLCFILFHVISGQFMPLSCNCCATSMLVPCQYHATTMILSSYYHATSTLLSINCCATVLFICHFISFRCYIILHQVTSCWLIPRDCDASVYHVTSCYNGFLSFCVISSYFLLFDVISVVLCYFVIVSFYLM